MARKFNETYHNLICEDVPRKKAKSIEDRGGYLRDDNRKSDPWIGDKTYAEDGFVNLYCSEY